MRLRFGVAFLVCVMSACTSTERADSTGGTERADRADRVDRREIAREEERLANELGAVLFVPPGCVSVAGAQISANGQAMLNFSGEAIDLDATAEQVQTHYAGLGWTPVMQEVDKMLAIDVRYPLFAWNAPAAQPPREAYGLPPLQPRGTYQTWVGQWRDDLGNVIYYRIRAIRRSEAGSDGSVAGFASAASRRVLAGDY